MTRSQLPSLEVARQRLIQAIAPSATMRPLRWSHGTTQLFEQGSGKPVLFVHGGLGQACLWLPLWAHLPTGRLLAVDRPGHGGADPFDYRGVDTMDHAVEFLRDVLDELGLERPLIVANSMGGRWALELALRHPERVERLVFAGAPAGSIPWVPRMLPMMRWPLFNRLIRRGLRRSTPDGARNFAGKLLVADPSALPDELALAMAAGQRRNVDSMFGFVERILTRRSIRPELVIGDRWRQLELPVTFIWGDRDAFDSPATGRLAASQCRDAELVEIAGAGHLPWIDQPLAVARAIEPLLGTATPLTAVG